MHTWRSCARYGDGEVINVNVNTEARDKNRLCRLRDELWWEVREEFEAGVISIPDDPILIEELAAFHYEEDNNGLIKWNGIEAVYKSILG